MLEHIHIKNFVVVDELSLECQSQLSAITGETGAGKSIWVDALCLALGQRAEPSMIRQGHDRATITLTFNINNNPPARHWLQQHDMDGDELQCLIQRTINKEGRSRATINGYPCPLNLIRELAPLLVLIHSQQLHRSLLKQEYQRNAIDAFADNTTLLENISSLYQQWQQCQSAIEELQKKMPQREQQLELLRYQLTELEALALQPNEWDVLSKQHQKLHHAQQIKDYIQEALTLTTQHEDHAADTLIQQAQQNLTQLPFTDDAIGNIQSLLNTANIHLQEAIDELRQYYQTVDVNAAEISELDTRLSLIHDLARKHHTTPEQLHEIEASLQQQAEQLEHIDESLQILTEQLHATEKKYTTIAQQLTKKRNKAAKSLSQSMTEHMQSLAMKGGHFNIQLQPNGEQITTYGFEQILFTVQTNPGGVEAPMHHIVSGGELSRLSLALQILLANKQHTPTLIFDEVDTGISGKTAAIVGDALKQLGQQTQVLCITHLPQVAAQASHHYKIDKCSHNNQTKTLITQLNQQQRVDELARLIGGTTITQKTKASAKELLALSLE